jgi:hypothetical protein
VKKYNQNDWYWQNDKGQWVVDWDLLTVAMIENLNRQIEDKDEQIRRKRS